MKLYIFVLCSITTESSTTKPTPPSTTSITTTTQTPSTTTVPITTSKTTPIPQPGILKLMLYSTVHALKFEKSAIWGKSHC